MWNKEIGSNSYISSHIDHFLGVYKLINQFGRPSKIILPFIEGDKFEIELILFSVFNANGNASFNKEAFAFFNDFYLDAKKQESDLGSFIIVEERYDSNNIDSYMLKQNNKMLPFITVKRFGNLILYVGLLAEKIIPLLA